MAKYTKPVNRLLTGNQTADDCAGSPAVLTLIHVRISQFQRKNKTSFIQSTSFHRNFFDTLRLSTECDQFQRLCRAARAQFNSNIRRLSKYIIFCCLGSVCILLRQLRKIPAYESICILSRGWTCHPFMYSSTLWVAASCLWFFFTPSLPCILIRIDRGTFFYRFLYHVSKNSICVV